MSKTPKLVIEPKLPARDSYEEARYREKLAWLAFAYKYGAEQILRDIADSLNHTTIDGVARPTPKKLPKPTGEK